MGNEKAAIKYLEQSLAIIRKQNNAEVEGVTLAVLGSIYNNFGKTSQALNILQQSLSVIDSTETANRVFYPYLVLARTYGNLNKPSVAIAYYKEAIKRIEKVRGNIGGLSTDLQESFLEAIQDVDGVTTAEIYRELADLLLSQGRILEAQQVLELLKIKEIDNFTKITNSRGEASPISLNRAEQKIIDKHGSLIAFGQQVYQCRQNNCKNQSQLNDQLEYLRAQYNQTVDTFVSVVRERKGQDDGFFDPRNLRDAQKIVEAKPNTVLIYPFVLEDKTWLLWVSEGGVVKSIEIAQLGQKQLGQSVLKFRNLINNPFSDIAEVQTAGKELYDLLIKPIEAELKKNDIKNLVFALDRASRYIPMNALYDGKNYLVENYNIFTVLSAELTDTRESLPIGVKNTPVLGLGLSDASSGWSALPNVKDEIDSIVLTNPLDKRGIFPGLEFLNQSFTRKVLRDNASKHKILHIATHGKFVPGSYLDSFLLLGDGKKLTIDDIRKLPDLGNAHLVVLSACETALADAMQDGVEIASLAYHFLNGGAETVMASLWLVNDESTRLLMENFYQNIALSTAKKPITKAQALRQAQLSLLHGNNTSVAIKPRGGIVYKPVTGESNNSNANNSKEYAHPYYWAAFILIGNGL
ncbi:MAG: CHAT domain-containing protein [Cyanobacteria bacterium P01_A01_bin.68]